MLIENKILNYMSSKLYRLKLNQEWINFGMDEIQFHTCQDSKTPKLLIFLQEKGQKGKANIEK